MNKIIVAYWSLSGNTEVMANDIGKGIEEAGKEAEVLDISKISMDDLKDANCFALGCPAMGAEVLEENEMEPFVAEIEKFAVGKNIGLFGSYGWGDGEWMRAWEKRMSDAGANLVGGEGLIAHETPDEAAEKECMALGKKLATI